MPMFNTNSTLSIDRLHRELASTDGAQVADWSGAAEILVPLVARLLSARHAPRDERRGRSRLGRAAKFLLGALPSIVGSRRRRPAMAPHSIPPPAVGSETPSWQLTNITRNFLLGFVMPLWLTAGVADWFCHRRARIETNSGSTESALHLLMLAEAAVPVIAGLLLEITSPILLLMLAAVVAHGATALCDVSYAVKRRQVTPVEQHVHSYLEMVPVMAVSFVAVLHWPELRALFGFGRRRPDWRIRWKSSPLPTGVVATLLACMLVLEVAPYLEEFKRTRSKANR
jgi:hypothetical protein